MSHLFYTHNHCLIDSSGLLIVKGLSKDSRILIVSSLAVKMDSSSGLGTVDISYNPTQLGNIGRCEASCSPSPCSDTHPD
jgi:hypothetical protein